MRIRKKYQVIPTNAKLENGHSTSATNGYTAEYINDHSVVVSAVEPSGSARKKVWKQHSGELFNKNNITDQSYISDTNGTITSNVSWLVTDYIEVSQGEELIINGNTSSTTGSGVYGIYYNSSKNVVSSIAYSDYKTNGTILTIPSGIKYVRLSVPISEKNTFSIKVEDKEYILNDNVYEEFNPQNEIYSANEQRIGTFFDKPLYRKSFRYTANNASYILTTDISSGIIDECWLGEPSFSREESNKNFYNITGGGYNGSSDYIYTRVIADQTYIKIDIRGDSLNRIKTGCVTLYYTKTTD